MGTDQSLPLFPTWRQAVQDAVAEFSYGQIIPHEWLYEHFDLPVPGFANHSVIKQWNCRVLNAFQKFERALLHEHRMYLDNVRGEGYLIVHPAEQTDVAWDKGVRTMRKALVDLQEGLSYIDYQHLDDKAKQHNVEKINKFAALQAFNRKKLK